MENQNIEIHLGGGGDGDRTSRSDLLSLAVILLLCGAFGYLRWVKMSSLTWGDSARWLFEGQRVAAGEIPYKDFSWPYGPFSVLVLGWALKWFGVSFRVAQVFIDTVSVALVFSAYLLIRLLLPRFLHAPAMFCLIAVCGTSLMFFNLFSFFTYTPALQTGAAGFLLFLTGVFDYVQTGRLKPAAWLMLTLGAFVAALSKPESLFATFCSLAVLAIGDRRCWFAAQKTSAWFRHYTKVAVASSGPALVAYWWAGKVAGFSAMWAGMTGYGQATATCPWWPTGLGLFGAAAALGEAAFVAATLSLTRRKEFATRYGYRYSCGLAAGLVGMCIYAGYVLYTNWELLTGNRSLADKLWYSSQSTAWSSAVLLPVMWTCVVLWIYLAFRQLLSRHNTLNNESFGMLVLLTGPVAMSARGWFNWAHAMRTDVPGICYPFFLILAPYLIYRLLALGGTIPGEDMNFRSKPWLAVTLLLTMYGLLRVIAAYPGLLSNGHYGDLSTVAGNVRLANYENESEIYRFVVENTSPGDTILDLPYGGGINFASHRLSPFFGTQFRDFSMTDEILKKDLEGLRRHPPKVVIADDAPNFGAFDGLQDCRCAFPRLVWSPATGSALSDKVSPAFMEIEQGYRVAKVVGRKLLLVPK